MTIFGEISIIYHKSSGLGSPTTWQLKNKTFPSLILHESKSLRNFGFDEPRVVIEAGAFFEGDLIISVLYVHTDSVISLPDIGGESSEMCK